MKKTAELTVWQPPQKIVAKEADYSHSAVSRYINGKFSWRKKYEEQLVQQLGGDSHGVDWSQCFKMQDMRYNYQSLC